MPAPLGWSQFARSQHLLTVRRWFIGISGSVRSRFDPMDDRAWPLITTHLRRQLAGLMDGIRCRTARLSLGHRLESVETTSIITSVPLRCDASFDLLTANGHYQLIVSALSAAFAELPLATT